MVIGKVKAGDNVLVHAGASGVGIAVSQLARLYGAKNVIATASSKEKLDCLLNLPGGIGPTHGVNYKTQDFAEEVKKITDGVGANVVIDFVGQSHWHKNVAALAVDGHMTMLGLLSGEYVLEELHASIMLNVDTSSLPRELTHTLMTLEQLWPHGLALRLSHMRLHIIITNTMIIYRMSKAEKWARSISGSSSTSAFISRVPHCGHDLSHTRRN